MNNTVNLILKFIGNDQSNFFDEVYCAVDQIEQMRSIEEFSELKWEAVLPHIDQILEFYDMNFSEEEIYDMSFGEDGYETVTFYKFKKLFEKTQFAAVNFLQSEAARIFVETN